MSAVIKVNVPRKTQACQKESVQAGKNVRSPMLKTRKMRPAQARTSNLFIQDHFASRSRTSEEHQINNPENQDDADIGREPFPESVPEENEIHTDDDGRHRRRVKQERRMSVHLSASSRQRW